MASPATTFRVRVDANGFEPSPWAWSIYQTGTEAPFMRSTLTFASRAKAITAGKKALADLHDARHRAETRARAF